MGVGQQVVPLHRHKRRFRLRKTTILLLGLIVLISFWPALKWLGLRFLHTERSYFGQVERSYQAQGIFIRREQQLLAPMTGRVELLVKSGTRVPKGAQLVKIVNVDLQSRLLPKLEEVKSQLAAHEHQARLDLSRAQERVNQKQLAIDNHTVKLKKQLAARNYVAARQLEEELSSLSRQRRTTLDELAKIEQEIANTRQELSVKQKEVERQLQRAEGIIRAKAPGIVSFQLDGLEELCQSTGYVSLFAKELLAKPQTVKDQTSAEVGQPVGRLIDNFQSQLALCLETDEDFSQGQAIYLHLPTSLETARVDKWTRRGDQTYLLCTLENYQPRWNNLRNLELEVATARKEGIVIPSGALIQRRGELGVWVRQEGQLIWKEVTLRLKTKEKAVVDGLPSGQAVITNPRFIR